MARTQFTFTFTNAQPGADVGFNFPAFADSSTTVADGTLVLDSTNSVSVWADAAYLIAHTVDGRGVQILGVATSAYPTQTIDAGVPGPNPFPSGGSTAPSSMTLNGGGGAYGATYAAVTFSDNTDPAVVGTDIVWDGVDTVTIATAGTYAVSWYADGSTTAGGSAEVWAKVSRNNDALGPFYYHETHKVIPASSDFDIDGSVTTPLAANDTLKLMVRATSGGANGPANGALTVTRVG